MGEQTTGCSLSLCAAQHTDVLQHQVLHVEHGTGASEPVLLTHHEALEENQRARLKDAWADGLPPLLCPSAR